MESVVINNNSWNIGDECWVNTTYNTGEHCKIVGFHESEKRKGERVQYAKLNSISSYGTFSSNKLFKTRQESIDADNAARKAQIEAYEATINSVDDLVNFMFKYNVSYCEEYTDYEAREAAINKAKELGININVEY